MMEHTTDRLFWTLTSVIVGALILTIGVKAFPNVASSTLAPMSGFIQQADTQTKNVKKAGDDAIAKETGQSTGSTNSSTQSNTNSQPTDPDAQAKANAVEASTLNLKVTPNGDGTGVLNGPASGQLSGTLNIPEYVKVNGQLTKITSIQPQAFEFNSLTSVTIPDSVTNIGFSAFGLNQLTSVNIPNSVTSFSPGSFTGNNLTSANVPNPQGYQSAINNNAFNYAGTSATVTVTNNPSN